MNDRITGLTANDSHFLRVTAKRCYHADVDVYRYNLMRDVKTVEELARKGDRISVQFDDEDLLRKIEGMAQTEERPTSRQIVVLVKAAIELIDEQGFHLINGKLRRGTFENLDTESEREEGDHT
jgi:uncharacterized protein YdcH (DUF465 family)